MPAPSIVAVLNGPNLDALGTRQPHLYGATTLADVDRLCTETGRTLGLAVECQQSNDEADLIAAIQHCANRAAAIVINPAGLTPTSIALHDALAAASLPTIEVHITAMHRREPFRHTSRIAPAATGTIEGLGIQGYALALHAAASLLEQA